VVWTALIWLRIDQWMALVKMVIGFHKMLESIGVVAQMALSWEGLSSMKLTNKTTLSVNFEGFWRWYITLFLNFTFLDFS
jgi:hypothetical protein